MSLVKTNGIVIDEISTGEADKILTIFTKKYGVIKASVKGACRANNTNSACSQFLVYSDYILYKGKDMYKLNSGEIINPFYEIRNDIIKLTYASYSAELIKEIVRENISSFRILQLFLNTLFMLAKGEKSTELIIRSFELKLMTLAGYKPRVENCAKCGKHECNSFNFEESGLLCSECSLNKIGSIEISPSTIKAIRYIIHSDMKQVFSFEVADIILKELKLINGIYIKQKLEKDFKSLKVLDTLA